MPRIFNLLVLIKKSEEEYVLVFEYIYIYMNIYMYEYIYEYIYIYIYIYIYTGKIVKCSRKLIYNIYIGIYIYIYTVYIYIYYSLPCGMKQKTFSICTIEKCHH